MSLKVEERIYVWTSSGEREIQLCIGDITALPLEDKVDIIMVSAFPNDYSPIHGTLLGALYHKLGLNVMELAFGGKKEDLRAQFNCWISQPLPERLPYRQLICFERSIKKVMEGDRTSLTQGVRDMFRAMMPVFNVENKSIITPLLGTGNQRGDMEEMLRTMVGTAVDWMRLGLPLQILKIVLYASDPSRLGPVDQRCISDFHEFKTKVEAQKVLPKELAVTWDIFLVCCDKDKEISMRCKKYLKKAKSDVKVVTLNDIDVKFDTWQHDVSNAMRASARVVPVLTEDFLSDLLSIDQFNVALCCNRLTRRHILAPVALDKLTVPAYMNMVQWSNCAPRDDNKLQGACEDLVRQISHKTSSLCVQAYDIFISYSHRNLTQAKALLEALQGLNPQPKIFFDYDELRTGVSWQQTLYTAVENSRLVLALVSSDYLASVVGQEEFNIALVKHLAKEKKMDLVPVMLEPVPAPPWTRWVQPLESDGRTGLSTERIASICDAVSTWMKDGKNSALCGVVKEIIDIDAAAEEVRSRLFEEHYVFNGTCSLKAAANSAKGGNRKSPTDDRKKLEETGVSPNTCDVYISHVLRDQRHADFIRRCLLLEDASLVVVDKPSQSGDASQAKQISSARCLVVLLSHAYLQSVREVEEMHVILNRERSTKDTRLLYVIQLDRLPPKPTYIHLVPCDAALKDSFWEKLVSQHKKRALGGKRSLLNAHAQAVVKKIEEKHGTLEEKTCLPLLKAVCDIVSLLTNENCVPGLRRGDTVLRGVVDIIQTPEVASVDALRTVSSRKPEKKDNGSKAPADSNKVAAGDAKPSIVATRNTDVRKESAKEFATTKNERLEDVANADGEKESAEGEIKPHECKTCGIL